MSTLRITAGALRGRRVTVPPSTRPTSERARQAFFNIAGARIDDARFLDLFAGSGIFSLEALSRGARSAVAVERSPQNGRAIEKAAATFEVQVEVIIADVRDGLVRLAGREFDLVYADPPYDYEDYDALLAAMDETVDLSADGLIAIEHRKNTTPFTIATRRLRHIRRAEYGEIWISFFGIDD